ncbi:PQQ-dependent sugar dehydrogenase [Edaphobacter modestus]|uniref:PQQ-dependent sugar dehydrogenase n=1 Tax=Edaphobacter modestus TaxID=388466 RepID=UPI001F5FEF63|nr:PQQ-dependent sugar dehydrogenase [Edaphobacter modestus]
MNSRKSISTLAFAVFATVTSLSAQDANFHNAPASSVTVENPHTAQADAEAGGTVYQQKCAACHGPTAKGAGNIPALATGATQSAKAGEVFWYITRGDLANGMPSWATLPEEQRWQVVSYLKYLGGPNAKALTPAPSEATASTAKFEAPAPKPPFTDFRYEDPGKTRKITVADLPQPYATESAGNPPKLVPRPEGVWPKALPGFKVEQYATGLENPRLIRTAPNGDAFVAETAKGQIRVFRGITADGKPEMTSVFATGLNKPFGIAFYPQGPNPKWIYIGNLDSVVRFPYKNGDVKASAEPEHIADIPGGRGHTTRDVRFSLDGKKMWVSVGSGSNVDDPDTNPAEKNRADVLEFNPDGSGMHIYAYGIRNCVGEEVNPITGELWCSVNERDALGDNLVPDYITSVKPGGFYGWPWWYMGAHQDPRHAGKHPELKDKAIVPDVLLNPHNASLQITFYNGKQFPAEYSGDIFASEHGSWNRSARVGYEVIRVPLHQTGHATGEYEDFLTGFVLPSGDVWGRPVGVTTAKDGSLLVTDDGSNSVWRVSYTGK